MSRQIYLNQIKMMICFVIFSCGDALANPITEGEWETPIKDIEFTVESQTSISSIKITLNFSGNCSGSIIMTKYSIPIQNNKFTVNLGSSFDNSTGTLTGTFSTDGQQCTGTYNYTRSPCDPINKSWSATPKTPIVELSWIQQISKTSKTLNSVHFINDMAGWTVGEEGTMRWTYNSGFEWGQQLGETTEDLKSIYFSDINHGCAVGGKGIILRTTNGGLTWSDQITDQVNTYYKVQFINNNTGWALGVYYSMGNLETKLINTNNGTLWGLEYIFPDKILFDMHFINAQIGWIVGAAGEILKTMDGGASWIPQISGTTENLGFVYFIDANNGWTVGGGGTILSTTNGGTSWIPQTSGTVKLLRSVSFITNNIGWIVGDAGTILMTSNGGSTWVPQESGTTENLMSVHLIDGNHGWAVGANGTILKHGVPPSNNQSPIIENVIPDLTLNLSEGDFTRDLNTSPQVFSDPDGDVLGYIASSSNSDIANVHISEGKLIISPKAEGTTTITLKAIDGKGGHVSFDFKVIVTSLIPPSNLTASLLNDYIELNWLDPSPKPGSLQGYSIYRSIQADAQNTGTVITTMDANTIQYLDTSVTAGTTYYYVITAIYPEGESMATNEVSISTEAQPRISVTPDTLYLSVGAETFQYNKPSHSGKITLSLQKRADNPISSTFFKQRNKPFQNILAIENTNLDTLGNVYEKPYYPIQGQWQITYEATKLVPTRNCTVKVLRYTFYNDEKNEQSKGCELYIWDDNQGKPGYIIWSIDTTVTMQGNWYDWVHFDISNENIVVSRFWMGHREKIEGPPTSLIDTLETPGANFYSTDGQTWHEEVYDHLHQAVVAYGPSEYEDVGVFAIKNTGNDILNVESISCNEAWVKSISTNDFNLSPGEERKINITCCADFLTNGHYEGTIEITSNDRDTPVYKVHLLFNVSLTSVEPEKIADSPSTFDLLQNYPNPFNPQTKIMYHIANTGWVEISVYNLNGQRIRTLVNEIKNTGHHEIIWDGKNEKGLTVSTGIYLCKMKTAEFFSVKKMVFTK